MNNSWLRSALLKKFDQEHRPNIQKILDDKALGQTFTWTLHDELYDLITAYKKANKITTFQIQLNIHTDPASKLINRVDVYVY